MFVTFTAPHHTSTSSTLDPHQNPSNRDSSKKDQSQDKPARQREKKREGKQKQTDRKQKRRTSSSPGEKDKTAAAIRTSGVSPLHHLGDEAGDGGGGLIWIQLGKQVADIVCCASLLPGDESKKPGRSEKNPLQLECIRSADILATQ